MSKPIGKVKDATPREAINSAAIRLFGAMGYNGTTMRDIAQEVGILAGSLYAHIDSKESLLAEIVQTGIEPYLAILRSLDGVALSPTEKLRAAIVTHVKVVAANPERTFVVFLTEQDIPVTATGRPQKFRLAEVAKQKVADSAAYRSTKPAKTPGIP